MACGKDRIVGGGGVTEGGEEGEGQKKSGGSDFERHGDETLKKANAEPNFVPFKRKTPKERVKKRQKVQKRIVYWTVSVLGMNWRDWEQRWTVGQGKANSQKLERAQGKVKAPKNK